MLPLFNLGENLMAKKETKKTSYPIKYLNNVNKCVYVANNAEEEKEFKDNPEYTKL